MKVKNIDRALSHQRRQQQLDEAGTAHPNCARCRTGGYSRAHVRPMRRSARAQIREQLADVP